MRVASVAIPRRTTLACIYGAETPTNNFFFFLKVQRTQLHFVHDMPYLNQRIPHALHMMTQLLPPSRHIGVTVLLQLRHVLGRGGPRLVGDLALGFFFDDAFLLARDLSVGSSFFGVSLAAAFSARARLATAVGWGLSETRDLSTANVLSFSGMAGRSLRKHLGQLRPGEVPAWFGTKLHVVRVPTKQS